MSTLTNGDGSPYIHPLDHLVQLRVKAGVKELLLFFDAYSCLLKYATQGMGKLLRRCGIEYSIGEKPSRIARQMARLLYPDDRRLAVEFYKQQRITLRVFQMCQSVSQVTTYHAISSRRTGRCYIIWMYFQKGIESRSCGFVRLEIIPEEITTEEFNMLLQKGMIFGREVM